MKKDIKIWKAIFKLNGTKCHCGNDLEVLSVKPLGNRYFILTANEIGKANPNPPFCFLFDTEREKIVPPGSFTPFHSKTMGDETIRRIIHKYESGKYETT